MIGNAPVSPQSTGTDPDRKAGRRSGLLCAECGCDRSGSSVSREPDAKKGTAKNSRSLRSLAAPRAAGDPARPASRWAAAESPGETPRVRGGLLSLRRREWQRISSAGRWALPLRFPSGDGTRPCEGREAKPRIARRPALDRATPAGGHGSIRESAARIVAILRRFLDRGTNFLS